MTVRREGGEDIRHVLRLGSLGQRPLQGPELAQVRSDGLELT